MRIAIWHNLPSGGGNRAFHDQVRGLVALGHTVEVWCPPSADRTFLPVADVAREHVVPLADAAPAAGWPFRRLKQLAWATRPRLEAMERHARECAAAIDAGGFDVLLVHPCRFFRASPVGRYVACPAVLYLQEPFRELYEAMPDLPWLAPELAYRPMSPGYWRQVVKDLAYRHAQRVQLRFERDWARSYPTVLVNSLFSRESLLRAYHVDSRVCYLGVDLAAFTAAPVAKERLVVGLGNLAFNKRPLLAVRAVGAIPADRRPRLVWIGNNADAALRAEAVRLAAELRVDLTIKLLVPDAELHDWLRRASAMIYTSHLEPFGYAPLEANACGTGVVAVAEGGVRETIVDGVNGLLVPGADPERLGAALQRFTADPGFATGFGRGARAHVETRWSLPHATATLESELRRAVALARPAPPSAGASA